MATPAIVSPLSDAALLRPEDGGGLAGPPGQHQDVGQLHAGPRVVALALELGLDDLDGAGVLLARDERRDVLVLGLTEERDGPSSSCSRA